MLQKFIAEVVILSNKPYAVSVQQQICRINQLLVIHAGVKATNQSHGR